MELSEKTEKYPILGWVKEKGTILRLSKQVPG
jgi:hypothetical protein